MLKRKLNERNNIGRVLSQKIRTLSLGYNFVNESCKVSINSPSIQFENGRGVSQQGKSDLEITTAWYAMLKPTVYLAFSISWNTFTESNNLSMICTRC